MRTHVTVVPSDKIISVEKETLYCTFDCPSNVHAIQWHEKSGHIEYTDGTLPMVLDENMYPQFVQPFVAAWQREKERLSEELNKPLPLEEARQSALATLKEKRLDTEYRGPLVEVNGTKVRFPSDVKDETRLNSFGVLFAVDPARVEIWKVSDGVYVNMDAPLYQQVRQAGFEHVTATFAIEKTKREEIESITTVKAIQIWLEKELDRGWPA